MTWGAFAAIAVLSWRTIQPGVEYTSASGVQVVRVDPKIATLTVALASESNRAPRTAAEWCKSAGLSVAINAGMFQNDQRSNVGYLRHGKHLNNPRWNDYQSALALKAGTALWLDGKRRDPGPDFEVVVQNLRLLAKGGKNVWSPSPRRWSEAALAIDKRGRLLFLFSRAPHTMRDFNAVILSLPLDVDAAMHLEGGPEASLSIHGGGIDLDLEGSFETGFQPDDSNVQQWPIPNVLGVVRR